MDTGPAHDPRETWLLARSIEGREGKDARQKQAEAEQCHATARFTSGRRWRPQGSDFVPLLLRRVGPLRTKADARPLSQVSLQRERECVCVCLSQARRRGDDAVGKTQDNRTRATCSAAAMGWLAV